MKDIFQALKDSPAMQKAFDFLESDRERTMQEQMEICSIASPSNKETQRALHYFEMFKQLGFDEVRMDEVDNVIGLMKGTGDGPTLVLAAHTDTVFLEDVDCTATIRDGIVYGPGIADDTRGMAELLTIARAMKEADIRPVGDILFVGNVGEESLGDLRGVKHLFKTMGDQIDGFLSIDGVGVDSLVYNATGSYKYKATFTGTGGHSFLMFGIPNANHAAGRAIAKIANLRTPENPRTTYNVGVVQGGVAVNAIPAEVSLMIDMRSNAMEELVKLEAQIIEALEAGCAEENAFWNHPEEVITLKIERLGSRPAGTQSPDDVMPTACVAAYEVYGIPPRVMAAASTDCNLPISLGIPAAALGRGGTSKDTHTIHEQWDPTDDYKGPQRSMLLALGLVGVDGISQPILPKRG
jgi:tripeptide aminopeptidase